MRDGLPFRWRRNLMAGFGHSEGQAVRESPAVDFAEIMPLLFFHGHTRWRLFQMDTLNIVGGEKGLYSELV
jgi:hypothetical protein